ncbi:MAG: ATP-grasp domain-containing protein [Candidatus Eisenbacteria bacterium]|nr:ATP-grasp domain-containing protein [Candidatus Eisenbacteria bacterium]
MNRTHPKKILIVGAGFLQSFAIRRAAEMGLYVVAVDRDINAPGFRWCHKREVADTKDARACLDVARRESVDAVVSVCTDLAVRSVAFVAERLGLPGLSAEAAALATDKWLMREALARAGVGCPDFGKAESVEQARDAASRVGLPCVIKPVDSVGSRGVTKVGAQSEVDRAFASAVSASASGSAVVEGFVDGPEMSIEAVTSHGKTWIAAVTDKITTGPPHFVEVGHTQPSVFSWNASVRQTVDSCVRALGIDFSATHTELRMTPSGPVVMEVGARLGGDRITSDLVPLSCGVDLMETVIRVALGEDPVVAPKWERGSAIRYLQVPTGVIVSIDGTETAASVKGIVDVHFDMSVGDRVPELRSSSDRVGHVVAEGSGAREAAEAAEKALSKIRVEVVA